MADAYGAIIVCGDFEGEIDSIVETLNRFQWTADGDEFKRVGDKIWMSSYGVQYPTVFPSRGGMLFGDGRKCFLDEASHLLVEEWENEGGDMFEEEYNLESLVKAIAHLLTSGTLELVASANEKSRYAYFERIAIRSDGNAERHYFRSFWQSGTKSCSEEFDPSAMNGKVKPTDEPQQPQKVAA